MAVVDGVKWIRLGRLAGWCPTTTESGAVLWTDAAAARRLRIGDSVRLAGGVAVGMLDHGWMCADDIGTVLADDDSQYPYRVGNADGR
jgi:hypothetical protein